MCSKTENSQVEYFTVRNEQKKLEPVVFHTHEALCIWKYQLYIYIFQNRQVEYDHLYALTSQWQKEVLTPHQN